MNWTKCTPTVEKSENSGQKAKSNSNSQNFTKNEENLNQTQRKGRYGN